MNTSTTPTSVRELRLIARPDGALTPDVFAEATVEPAELDEGQVLVRNEWMLLSVVLRDLMEAEPNPELPMQAYQLGEAPWTPTVGTVVRSRSADYAEGDLVYHTSGFRDYAVLDAGGWDITKLDRRLLPTSAHFLSQAPGMTAWRGMVSIAAVGEGDTVFVSGATSGVGSLAGQIAKCRGAAKVIGSTGSKDKVSYLVDELGFDAAFDYHDGPVADRLAELAPDGVSVFFDNVGGDQFEAALASAAANARFVLCGVLSETFPKLDVETVVLRDITIRGFTTDYSSDDLDQFLRHYGQWTAEGRIAFAPTVIEGGLSAVPQALVDQLNRKFRGPVLVKLDS